ncbi:MAG TPA: alpha/beta hydrolase [Chitinophagaceae bacterium]|nr:alpha/beta hydrolase [Chitinophagaceae bacterium]
MNNIYCISGFGADERVFSKLNFGDDNVHFIPWLLPEKRERISDYAKRMAEMIHHENPVLLGLSFGGMMCIEVAKFIETKKVVLISSIKSLHEVPLWMKLAGRTQLNKIFPLRSFRLFEPIQNYNLGIENKTELQLVKEFRKNIGQQYTNWAANEILNWKNDWNPDNLYHIHGSKDHMFPIRNIKTNYVIPGGGHFMVMNRAEKVNEVLGSILPL